MIRIHKGDPPVCLLNDGPALVAADYLSYDAVVNKQALTRDERNSFRPDPLYRRDVVKAALIDAQAGEKCCYCEKDLSEDGKHVDHFRPFKAVETDDGKIHPGYFWLGYTWANLYLACLSCNSSYKKDKFPLSNPAARVRPHDIDLTVEDPLLIDPGAEDPRDHLRFRRDSPYAFEGSPKGATTIEVLQFRKRPGLRAARHKRFGELERLRNIVEIFRDNPTYFNLRDEAIKSLDSLRKAVERSAVFSSMAKDFLDDFLEGFECA